MPHFVLCRICKIIVTYN